MDLSIHYNSSWGIISSNRKIAEGKLLFFFGQGACARRPFRHVHEANFFLLTFSMNLEDLLLFFFWGAFLLSFFCFSRLTMRIRNGYFNEDITIITYVRMSEASRKLADATRLKREYAHTHTQTYSWSRHG